MIRAENPFSSPEEPDEEKINREVGIEHSKEKRRVKKLVENAGEEMDEIVRKAEEGWKRRN